MKIITILLFIFISLNIKSQTITTINLQADYQTVHHHLDQELIPFREKRAVDNTYGGFRS